MMISNLRISKIKNFRKHYKYDNVIFIWIPKTAGTSLTASINQIIPVQEYLKVEDIKHNFPNTGFSTFGHISLRALLDYKLVSKKYYNNSKTFCISRNPYDRFISLYHYSKKVNRIPDELTIDEFVTQIKNGIPNIGLYNVKGLSQCHPQITWIKDIRIDNVFKFEDITNNSQSIYDYLGIKPAEMTHLNKSSARKSFTEELQKEHIEFVNSYYKADFDYFGYSLKS